MIHPNKLEILFFSYSASMNAFPLFHP
jgi:hypothetical protein